MSMLEWPRIYFDGYTYWNPSTFNNNDYEPLIDTYDPANAQLNWSFLHREHVDSPAAFRRWAIRPQSADPTNLKNRVPPAEWGYYGGNECGFVTASTPQIEHPAFSRPDRLTLVTGYTNASGAYVRNGDPWIGQQVQLNLGAGSAAKLVDINPAAFWSSQIFADSITLGAVAPGATTPAYGFSGPTFSRLFARWHTFGHNYNTDAQLMIAGTLSSIFQTTLPKADLRLFGADAPLYAELLQALAAPDALGLMLRFTTYNTLYFHGPYFSGPPGDQFSRMVQIAELYERYAEAREAFDAGKTATPPPRPVNRAYSRTVGWFGIWKAGDWATAPNGRRLLPMINPGQSAGLPQPQPVQAKGLPCSYYQPTPQGVRAASALGPAVVEVRAGATAIERLTVDLGSAIPDADSTGVKAVFGAIRLALELPAGRRILAVLADDSDGAAYAADYLRTAGIIDLPGSALPPDITPAMLAANPLLILVDSFTPTDATCTAWTATATVALTENPLIADTDDRGVYVEEPNAPWQPDPPSPTLRVQVRSFGGPPPADTRLLVAQYGVNQQQMVWQRVTASNPGIAPYVELTQVLASGRARPFRTWSLCSLNAGEAAFQLRGLRPGQPNLVCYPVAPQPRRLIPPMVIIPPSVAATPYSAVRVLPFHNQSALAFEEWLRTEPEVDAVNQTVFDAVFRTYALMYPTMDFIHDALQFQQWRGRILDRTDPAIFESAAYMPVTRALSAGQRRIIELYVAYLARVPQQPITRQQTAYANKVRRG